MPMSRRNGEGKLRRPLMDAVVGQAGTTANVPYCMGPRSLDTPDSAAC
jgi:hypothetical protein